MRISWLERLDLASTLPSAAAHNMQSQLSTPASQRSHKAAPPKGESVQVPLHPTVSYETESFHAWPCGTRSIMGNRSKNAQRRKRLTVNGPFVLQGHFRSANREAKCALGGMDSFPVTGTTANDVDRVPGMPESSKGGAQRRSGGGRLPAAADHAFSHLPTS
jgi:hypothetical protein